MERSGVAAGAGQSQVVHARPLVADRRGGDVADEVSEAVDVDDLSDEVVAYHGRLGQVQEFVGLRLRAQEMEGQAVEDSPGQRGENAATVARHRRTGRRKEIHVAN